MKFFLTAIFFSAYLLTAQQNWLSTYGGGTVEEVLDMSLSQNANTVMVGYFTGNSTYGTTSLSSNGNSDILIVKTDLTGNVVWAKKAGGTGADRANSVTTDANGNIYITGTFFNSANFGSITINGQNKDVFITKMDANGNFIWAKAMGGQYEDIGYGIEVDNSGNIICTGKYKGTANFGSTVLNSAIDPTTSLSSFDVFIVKLDQNGNYVWVKDGNAKFDDRGVAVTIDDVGKSYVTIEFSDTITFNNMYPNAAPNAGLVLCVDANGNEQWVTYFRAGQTLINDIKWKNNKLYLTGDFRNNLAVQDINNTTTYNAINDYYTFVSRFTDGGDLEWLSTNFSDNEIFSNQLCLDNNNDIYTVGLFRCSFTEMNQTYGNSTFLSLGYRDVHYMKYSNSGQFMWSRQFGSNKDDYSASIIIKDVDYPIISGSFENIINLPTGSNFTGLTGGTTGTNVSCGSASVGTFTYTASSGSKDVFLTSPFDINRLPYDYYAHYSNPCSTDTVPPCIHIDSISCADTIEVCYTDLYKYIYVDHFQIGSFQRPLYNYLWNNGSTNGMTFVNLIQSTVPIYQDYTVEISREDGCAAWTDSVVVVINPLPPPPLFTDVWNYNNLTSPPNPIDTCLVSDSLTIYASSNDPYTNDIGWLNGVSLNDSTIYAPASDAYYAYVSNIFGCTSFDSIIVSFNEFAIHDTLDPYINIAYDINNPLQPGDTVYMCENTQLLFYLFDSSYVEPDGTLPFLQTLWSFDNTYPPDTINHDYPPLYYGQYNHPVTTDGWHNISAHLINKCGDTIDYYLDRDFYVVIVPTPQLTLSSLPEDCINSSVMVYAQYNTDTIVWFSNQIDTNYVDSVLFDLNYSLNLISAQIDTFAHGIMCSNSQDLLINGLSEAEITSDPVNGIVCMGDSALLTANNGDAWYWISPNGDTISTNQTLYVTTPGIYNCLISFSSGCELASNFIEILVYDNPDMIVNPGAICNGDNAEIEVFATANASINWLPPLSGSSTTQIVNSGGVYYCQIGSCNGTIIDSVIVYESNPQVSLNFVGDTLICPNDSVFIQAISNIDSASFNWNTNLTDSSFTTYSSGQYCVQITDTLGCLAHSDTINVMFASVPQLPTVNDTIVCRGDDVVIQVSSQNQINWFQNNQLINTGNTLNIPNIQNNQAYQINSFNGSCTSQFLAFNINLYPDEYLPNIIGNDFLCQGEDIILSLDTLPFILYHWTTPNGQDYGSSITVNNANVNDSGNYGVYILNANCVKDTNFTNIKVQPNPSLGLPYDTTFCLDEHFIFSTDYDYTFETIFDTDFIHDSLLIYHLTDQYGCYSDDTLHILYVDCQIDFPNIFSPNNDNTNDVFYFNIINGEILHLLIYNRWGNLIYETYQNEWDGIAKNGKLVSDGTYFYIVEYKFNYKDTVYKKQGTIQVVNQRE